MPPKSLFNRLRNFDAYPKTLEDFRVKTFGGAVITCVSGLLMIALFLSELNYYLTPEVQQELFVDTTRGQKLKINIDIVFPKVGCSFLSIDAMDVSGEQQIDVDHNIFKQRLDLDGNPIAEQPEKEELGSSNATQTDGEPTSTTPKPLDPDRCESCYGAESKTIKCCNTCDQVREAYRQKGWAFTNANEIQQCDREGYSKKAKEQMNEGCNVFGYLEVNKVAGNFHIAPGRSFQQHHVHVHDLQSFGGQTFNMTHRIRHLSFGQDYPGIVNPLDETQMIAGNKNMMQQYYVKIVPTMYANLDGSILNTNQYSVTKHQKAISSGLFGEQGLPGVFLIYELSPIMIKLTEKQRSFMHFLTSLCAIIGGIFTVAGLIDAAVYNTSRVIQQKMAEGKFS